MVLTVCLCLLCVCVLSPLALNTLQPPKKLWCDNVMQQRAAFGLAFSPYLQGDADIMEDGLHCLMRYTRVVKDDNPLKREYIRQAARHTRPAAGRACMCVSMSAWQSHPVSECITAMPQFGPCHPVLPCPSVSVLAYSHALGPTSGPQAC